MISIMDQIEKEHPELFALELEKMLNMTLFTLYHLQILSKEHPELFALELEKMLNMTLFTLYYLQILSNQHQTWSKCM